MAKFKVGDKVVSREFGSWTNGLTGVIIPNYKGEDWINSYLVKFDKKAASGNGHDKNGNDGANWYIDGSDLELVKTDTFTIGSTTDLATDMNLGKQQRVILQHLRDGKNITQMKAMGVYHIPRLSDVIMKLRRKGYNIVTEMCDDEVGGQYASYSLAK